MKTENKFQEPTRSRNRQKRSNRYVKHTDPAQRRKKR